MSSHDTRDVDPMPPHTVEAMPASWYHDRGIWDHERRRIFGREWLWVGRSQQVAGAGDCLTVEPAGFPVFLLRDVEGQLRGFHNVCRHRAMRLVPEGTRRCPRIVCPYHGWRYAPNGQLLKAPRFEGADDFDPEDYPLFALRVHEWRGLIFVCMDQEAPDFKSWFGPLLSHLELFMDEGEREFHGDLEVEVACNWKNYVDNFQEGYHIPLVHPSLARDTEWPEYRVINLPGGCLHEVPPRDSGNPQRGVFGWKYPNLMFNTFGPGVSFLRVEPLGPRRVRNCYSHFRPVGFDPERYERDAVRYGWEVSGEDRELTPLVQRNLEAGVYQAGPLSPRHENGLWHFHEMVRRSLDLSMDPV